MRKTILAAAMTLATAAWAQTSAPAPEAKALPEAVKPAPKAGKAVRKASSKRQQDARHCLQRASNDAIIRCAEEYL